MTQANAAAVIVSNHGSIVLLQPTTPEARAWFDENLSEDHQEFGGAIACEPRYVGDILDGLTEAGFSIQ